MKSGIEMRDMSAQYYDSERRLASKRRLQSRLQNCLSQADNIEDLLQIERSLNEVISDIEA